MGSGEYSRWVDYYSVEPWGAYRDNLHAGIIASAVYGLTPRRGKALTPSDFILKTHAEQREESLREGVSRLKMVAKPKGAK